MSAPSLFFFSVVLAITSVCISILILGSVVDFLQNPAGILVGIALNLYISLGRIDNLILLSLPIK